MGRRGSNGWPRTKRPTASSSSPSSRSTGSPPRCSTRTGCSCVARRAATARSATTSPRTCGQCARCRCACRRRRRRGSWCVARSYMPRAEFERVNREREVAGEPLYANPRNVTAGSIRQLDSRQVATRRLAALVYQIADGPPCATHSESLERLAEWGFPVHDAWRRCRGLVEVEAFIEEWREKRHEPRLRDRRRGGEDRRTGAARAARFDRQGAALGGGLQVRTRAGGDAGARHRGAGRAHGSADAGGRVRSGARRRFDGAAGDPAQLRGPVAQGRAGRRHRGDREGRRGHSARRRGAPRPPPGRVAAVPPADPLPRVRRAGGAVRGRGRLALRQPRMPGGAAGDDPALRLAQCHGHRGSGRRAHRPARRRRHVDRHSRALPPRSRAAGRAPGLGGEVGRQSPGVARREPASPALPAPSSGSASAWSANARRSSSPSTSVRSRRSPQASEEELQVVDEIGPKVAASLRAFFADPRQQRRLAALAAAGVEPAGDRAPDARRPCRSPARPSSSPASSSR